ncbi:MAG: hypothetical protein WAM14_06270 [Candidatus Nitrosopolaris sp.]
MIDFTTFSVVGIQPTDIEFVAAFDITDLKVGKDLSVVPNQITQSQLLT